MTDLFIYGTLKRGQCRARYLAGQWFLGEAKTAPRYRLLNCGEYPGLIAAVEQQRGVAPARSIHGELWRVTDSCLATLDRVEGTVEHLFERRAIALADRDGPVEAYFFAADADGLPDAGDRW